MNFIEKEANTIHFHTMSGQLPVEKRDDWYELDFPAVLSESISVTAQMMEALGLSPIEAFLNRDLVFVLDTEEEVKQANPDFSKLEKLPNGVGVAITARGSDCDFVSRGFYPKLKVNEDPVTGSLHCSLVLIGQRSSINKSLWQSSYPLGEEHFIVKRKATV
jgi:predicted PhzF superfamily epimerase YddE/YHI9